MKNTVILFNPCGDASHSLSPIPFSLLAVGTPLQKAGYKVMILDERVEDTNFIKKKIDENLSDTLMIGMTCMTGSPIKHALSMAKYIKSKNEEIPIVWGGFHPSLLPEQTIQNELVNIIVKGHGMETIIELANALSSNKPLDGIKGIVYKSNNDVRYTPDRPFSDKFAEINYDLIDAEKYITNYYGMRWIDYLSSYGCPHRCSFCSISFLYGHRWWSLPAKKVVDDWEYLTKKYNVTGIRLSDDNFYVNKQRIEEICDEIIKRGLKIKWEAMTRASYVAGYSDEFLEKLKKAGLFLFVFGMESGLEGVLEKIKKDTTVEENLKAIRRCKEHSIEASSTFMVGFPFETDKDVSDLLDFFDNVHSLNPKFKMMLCIYGPGPNTELYNETVKKYGIKPKTLEEWGSFDWGSYDYNQTPYITRERRERLQTISFVVQFLFGRIGENLTKPYQKIGFKFLSGVAKLRWRYRFFKFPVEWHLYTFIKNTWRIKIY